MYFNDFTYNMYARANYKIISNTIAKHDAELLFILNIPNI